ncbi:Hydroxysteroid dehydrogenase-like protein 2 [Halotydeus destructor]|nr:Hydroxysteroid dehydrogenase-like protein 2 [Halotydeus destructor]
MIPGKLAAKTVFITGASRGLGRAFAERIAKDGANVVVTAKTVEPNPKIGGTIYETEKAVIAAGGKCLPIQLDVRNEEAVADAIKKTVETFGGLDIVINNASAMFPFAMDDLETKRFLLMNDVILKGSFFVTKYAMPHLKLSSNPHILNIVPPLHIVPSWFKHLGHLAVMKYAASLHTLTMAEELREAGIAVNGLWPKTACWSAFVLRAGGYTDTLKQFSRKPTIMSDAAHAILTKKSTEFTGNFMYDDEMLLQEGCNDLEQYSEVPGNPLMVDIFVREEDCKGFKLLAPVGETLKGVRGQLKPKAKL